jgi:CBS domain-containing protein
MEEDLGNELRFLKASDILIDDVITATEDDKIRDIETLMFKKGIGGLPVVRHIAGRIQVVGMVTHRDIIIAKHSVSIGGMQVRDLMSHDIITVKENSSIIEILRKMKEFNVERIPVVDQSDNLKGLIMHRNILFKILEILEKKGN